MKVLLKFFAAHRELVGAKQLQLELEEGLTTDDVFDRLVEEYPPLEKMKGYTFISVNHVYAKSAKVLNDGDEVAFFPPVGGG